MLQCGSNVVASFQSQFEDVADDSNGLLDVYINYYYSFDSSGIFSIPMIQTTSKSDIHS